MCGAGRSTIYLRTIFLVARELLRGSDNAGDLLAPSQELSPSPGDGVLAAIPSPGDGVLTAMALAAVEVLAVR